jgi:hypothetical protein
MLYLFLDKLVGVCGGVPTAALGLTSTTTGLTLGAATTTVLGALLGTVRYTWLLIVYLITYICYLVSCTDLTAFFLVRKYNAAPPINHIR